MGLRIKKRFIFFISSIIFIGILWFSSSFWLTEIGKCLYFNEALQPVDIIIVLSGDDEGFRLRQAYNLYQKRYAKKILLSGGTNLWKETGIDLMENYLIKLGVSKEDILSEKESESTVENALFSKRILEKRGLKSAIVVTSPPHTRRVSIIFRKTFSPKIKILVCSNPDAFKVEGWWQNPSYRRTVIREFFQIGWYLLFGE